MIEEILLLSGNDIPFLPATINIHQPRIKDIAFVGEENFFVGCQLLSFSKDVLNNEDRIGLEDVDDFDILMSIVNDDTSLARIHMTLVLTLIFPEHNILIKEDAIELTIGEEKSVINKDNFAEFREVIKAMFYLQQEKKDEFNPKNEAARKIAEKLMKGREKVAQAKGLDKKKEVNLLSRYVSILATGLKMDMNVFLGHTVFQLHDQFIRFQRYVTSDIHLKAQLAGATDLEDIDDWMGDIHSGSK